MKLTGAKIVMECLMEQGVDTVFGYPGGTILNVYDAMYDYSDRLNHILTSHEQGASHAADGYARATGKVGVCFATSGPGATNLITGIATANSDSSPIVFITCNVTENVLGKDAFQEVDTTGISMPITKASYIVAEADKIAPTIREAFSVAAGGRPGPVMIDILKNATADEAEYEPISKDEHHYYGRLKRLHAGSRVNIDLDDVKILSDMIKDAKRPVILAGGGVILSGAENQLLELGEKLSCPVANTIMGLGSIPGDHPQFTGFTGMHGSKASNYAVSHCDLIIAIGTRFSDRVASSPKTFGDKAKKVHIDIDRAEIDKNVLVDHHIIGDAKEVLTKLLPMIEKMDFSNWMEEVNSKRTDRADSTDYKIHPKEILQTIQKVTNSEAIIVTDVGQHQMWSCQHYKYKTPRQLITSGGFGTMGFGYGAAIGAKLAKPDKIVVHTTGDGCFRMNCHEMSTADHYGIPIITVIFNNGTLGMVRQWQTLMYKQRYSQTTLDRGPDFVKLAEAYGLDGYKVESIEEFEKAFQKAVASGRGTVIDCRLGIDEKVSPMVSGGKPLTEYLLD